MITDGEKWYYLALKNVSFSLKGINWWILVIHDCLHLLRIENKLKPHEYVCKNYDYCYKEMPEKGKYILNYNPGKKINESAICYLYCLLSICYPFIIYKKDLLEKKQKTKKQKKNKQKKQIHVITTEKIN